MIGKNGPKLQEMELAGKGWTRIGVGRITGKEVSMPPGEILVIDHVERPSEN